MNGRVYDYNIGRFMSVDPFIQGPANTQSLNPYSYIMNNPLSGTDPTGYLRQSIDCKEAPDSCESILNDLKETKRNNPSSVKVRSGETNEKISGTIGDMVSELLQGFGRPKQLGDSPRRAPKARNMPELLDAFVNGRVSFPSGLKHDEVEITIGRIFAQASNYFGLEDSLESDAGWVARTAIGEFNGMRQPYVEAMAWVIRNRVENKHFPNTFQGVVLQRKQFSSWNTNDPNYDRVMNPETTNEWFIQTLSTVRGVLNAPSSQNPLPNVRHYYSPRSMTGGKTPNWAVEKSTVKYKDIKSNYMTLVEG